MNTLFSKIIIIGILLSSSYNLFAHVELDNPKGGETFVSGTTINIQWHITITHVTLNWDLLFSSDDGMTWEAIQMDIPAGALSYQWQVPNLNTALARVSIIQDNEGQDYQDESNNFTIQYTTTSIPTIPEFNCKLFPNPVSEFLTVDLSSNTSWPAQLRIVDVAGQSVWHVRDASVVMQIPVISYGAGIYFLQIETAQGVSTRKVIIQKS
jgi:hypothetical protein